MPRSLKAEPHGGQSPSSDGLQAVADASPPADAQCKATGTTRKTILSEHGASGFLRQESSKSSSGDFRNWLGNVHRVDLYGWRPPKASRGWNRNHPAVAAGIRHPPSRLQRAYSSGIAAMMRPILGLPRSILLKKYDLETPSNYNTAEADVKTLALTSAVEPDTNRRGGLGF